VKGHHIPLGEDFNEYIKQQIQKPKLVILLMTPAYMESSFCLMELGAAWAQSSKSLAIVVPPIDFTEVTKTLGLKQAWKITDRAGLVDLRHLVVKAIPKLERRTEHTWDDKRTHWNIDLKKVLAKLQQATRVDATKYQEVRDELNEKNEEIERLETALEGAEERYSELEKLKDKQEVKALRKRTRGSQALQEEFDELIQAVNESRPEKISDVVIKHIIMDHFGKAGSIDWSNDRPEFERAVQYGLIDSEDDRVQWNRNKLKPFKKAIEAVEMFLSSEEGDQLRKLQDDDVPMDPDDLAFWEHHL
jgi:TIR domain